MTVYRNIILLIVLLLSPVVAAAQGGGILVSDLKPEPTSLEANIKGGIFYDINGRQCALIKIETTHKGFTFDFGVAARVEHLEEKMAEIFIWVGPGAKFMTISHPELGKSDRFSFPEPLESAKTYTMKLTTADEHASVASKINQQYLVFEVEPKDAVLFVNEELWPLDDGIASKYVDFGDYSWRVEADDYHTEAGMVSVRDDENKVTESVNLNPAFGYLSVPSTPDSYGADIYVDHSLIGQVPIDNYKLKSGDHTLLVAKKYYDNYETLIHIDDAQRFELNPVMTSNTAMTTLIAESDVEILINGEVKGKGEWRGLLESGKYRFETRKEFHNPRSHIQNIVKERSDTIHLPSPTPQYGAIRIETKPQKSKVYIDGELKGETPISINHIQAGHHSLSLQLDGYYSIEDSIVVYMDRVDNYIRSFVDGNYVVGQSDQAMDANATNIRRELIKPTCMYVEVQGACNTVPAWMIGGAVGGYLRNINAEVSYQEGLTQTPDIYWYDKGASEYAPAYITAYKPSVLSACIGYQIRVSRGVSFTPQLGVKHTMLSSKIKGSNGDGSHCLSGVIGARMFFAVTPFMGVSVSPKFSISLSESEMYGQLSALSSDLAHYKSGLSLNGGLVFFF